MRTVRAGLRAALAMVALVLLTVAPIGCSQQSAGGVLPTDGAGLVQAKCQHCHPLSRVQAANHDKAGWTTTVNRMTTHGLQVTDAQKAAIIDYLSTQTGQ